MEEIKLEDYIFGYADAETEYFNSKKIFEEAFYDPKRIVDKLINGYEFLLIGRKGVGKTAFSAKIRSLAEKDEKLFADLISLSDFEFRTFYKMGNNQLDGTKKFKSAWDVTLLVAIFKTLDESFDLSESESFNNATKFLSKYGLFIGDSINNVVRILSKKTFHFKLPYLIAYDNESNYEEKKATQNEIVEYLQSVLKQVYLENNKVLFIVDGLDDILRYKQERLLILSGLIRSINELNLFFKKNFIPIKIILLAREDILASITDPDFNKIRRDAGIHIKWNAKNEDDDLKSLVNLRFKLSGIDEGDIVKQWYKIFPRKIRGKDSWSYILEYTLNKPRDILQFLTQCQKTFPNKISLSFSDVDYVLTDYSNEYFIEEMKNELAGFIEDETIYYLPQIMQKIGGSDFSYTEFRRVAEEFIPNKEEGYYKALTLVLFENGYLGQVSQTRFYDKQSKRTYTKNQAIFKHKKPTARINYSEKFTLHKGFYKALNIIKR